MANLGKVTVNFYENSNPDNDEPVLAATLPRTLYRTDGVTWAKFNGFKYQVLCVGRMGMYRAHLGYPL